MRKALYILIYLLWIVPFNLSSQSYVLDKVIATVGNEYILLSELEEEYAYAKKQDPTIGLDIKCNILDGLIAQNLIIHRAKLDSVSIADEEVEAMLDARFSNILRSMNNDEEFFENYYGASVNEMKDKYRDDQRQILLAERMQGILISNVDITPQEVKEYFYKIPTDSLPYLNAEVEIGEIVIKPDVNAEEKRKATEKLAAIREKIVSGEATFEEMAKDNSMDGSANQGGDLGFAKRGSYVPEFEEIAFTLEKDELSDIVETEFGFHLIKQVERRGLNVRVKHILIRPKITQADIDLAMVKIDSVKTLLTKDSMDFVDAVRKFSLKSRSSYTNAGRVTNPQTGTTFFETDQLDPDVYFAISDLQIGDISEPIEIKVRGETMFQIIKLLDKTKPHKASLDEDYDKIAFYAKESKKNIYFSEWVEEKMEETYIRVEKEFDFCPDLIKWIEGQ